MPVARLYRPGEPFVSAELQMMLREGVLSHVLDDVYVPGGTRIDTGTRVDAVARMLPPRLKRGAVICGATAAWVLIGGPAPERVTLIVSSGRRRRPAGGLDWQLHQVPVEADELLDSGPVPATSPARTTEDLFLGVGTPGSRGPLDSALERMRNPVPARLEWPSRDLGDFSPDERLDSFHRTDRKALQSRWETLSRLLRLCSDEIDRDQLLTRITGRLARRRKDSQRTAIIADLLDQCTSRRFSTVR